jgi:predicted glycosyltransferase
MALSGMRVWIDLANSPHPLIFAPVARELERAGSEVLITAREHAQTIALTRERWERFDLIGGESPAGRVAKASAIAARIGGLCRWARRHRPDLALSHNSYAQIVAARATGIPVLTAMDYERQPANHLAFRLAGLVLLPEAVPGEIVSRQGARGAKVRRYPGLKESLYVGDFDPNPRALDDLGIERSDDQALVVARTPPSRAIYHRLHNPLFIPALQEIAGQPNARCVVLTRHPEQRRALEELSLPNCVIPNTVVDARSLMYEADLVLGAGGTMTREAALMGVPTLSVFAGRRPAVDQWLEGRGALRRLLSVDQVSVVRPRTANPRPIEELRRSGRETLHTFVDATAAAARLEP